MKKEISAARYEHAFLLRCEGKTFREIGARLGISGQRARVKVRKFARELNRRLRRAHARIVK